MAALSNYAENALLDYLFGKNDTDPLPHDDVYVALFTSDPGEDASGSEVSGTSYVRKAIQNQDGDNEWADAVAGVKKNSTAVTFPAAGGSWGTVTHVAIFSALTGTSELLAYGPLTESKTVGTGDVFSFGVGDLQITLD